MGRKPHVPYGRFKKKLRGPSRFDRNRPKTEQVWIEEEPRPRPRIVIAERPRVVVSADCPFEPGYCRVR